MYTFNSKNIKEDSVAFAFSHSKGLFIKTLIFLTLITVGALVSMFADIHNKKNIILAVIMVISTVAILLTLNNGIRKAPLKNKYVQKTKEINLVFNEDGIVSHTTYDDGEADGSCGYDKIIKVKEDRKRIYCYISMDSAFILNKSNLSNVEEFKNFLKSKVNKYVI